MADLIFAGVKVAFKVFKAYKERAQELEGFAEDLEDLLDRFQTSEVIFLRLEDKVVESHCVPLEMMKKVLNKAQTYCDKLVTFVKMNSGKPLRSIMICACSAAINSIPADLVPFQSQIMEYTEKFGVMPENKFGKFAQDLHFYVSAAAAMASIESLSPSKGQPKTTVSSVKTEFGNYHEVPMAGEKSHLVELVSHPVLKRQPSAAKEEFKDVDIANMSQEEVQDKLVSLAKAEIEDGTENDQVILLGGTSRSSTWLVAIWLNGKPHLIYVNFFGRCPFFVELARAPSTDYLLRIHSQGLETCNLGYKSHALTFFNAWERTRSELNISRGIFCKKFFKKVSHKGFIGLGSFLPLCGYCIGGAYFTGLTISGFVVEEKPFCVQFRNSTCIIVNGVVVFDPDNKTKGVGTQYI
jgi:hypothetical protein